MLGKQLLTSFSLFVIFGAVHSDEGKSCIDAQILEPLFEADEFFGHFLLTASNDQALDEIECLQYLILAPLFDYTSIVKLYRKKSDNSTHMEFRKAKIDMDGRGTNINKQPVTIVGTDYNNYIVSIACDESTNTDIISVLMAAGNSELTGFEDAQKSLDPYNIKINASLTFMNQDGCPKDWSDAEMYEIDFIYDYVKFDLFQYSIVKRMKPHSNRGDKMKCNMECNQLYDMIHSCCGVGPN